MAGKMLYEQRRGRWQGAQDIGAWCSIFEILTWVAVVTNVAVLAFTSYTLTDVYGLDDSSKAAFLPAHKMHSHTVHLPLAH